MYPRNSVSARRASTTIWKPCRCSASGMPPTFMPKRPATRLIGRARTVTTVSENEERPVGLLVDLGGKLLLQEFDPLHQGARVHYGGGKLLRGLAQVLKILAADPGGRAAEEP